MKWKTNEEKVKWRIKIISNIIQADFKFFFMYLFRFYVFEILGNEEANIFIE